MAGTNEELGAVELAAAFIAGADDRYDAAKSAVLDLFPGLVISRKGQILQEGEIDDTDADPEGDGQGVRAERVIVPDLTPVELTIRKWRARYERDRDTGILLTSGDDRTQVALAIARALGRGMRRLRLRAVKAFNASWLITGWTHSEDLSGTPITADATDTYGILQEKFRQTDGDTFFAPVDVYDAWRKSKVLRDAMPDGVQRNSLTRGAFASLLEEIAGRPVRIVVDRTCNKPKSYTDYTVDPLTWIGRTKIGDQVRTRANPLMGAPREPVAGMFLTRDLPARQDQAVRNGVMLADLPDVVGDSGEASADRLQRLFGFRYEVEPVPGLDQEHHHLTAVGGFATLNPQSGAALTACLVRS